MFVHARRQQQGITLAESLVAMLLFSVGLIGLIAMYTQAASANGDAGLRSEAANYATEAAQRIAGTVNRGADAMPAAGALAAFQINADAAVSEADPCGAGGEAPASSHALAAWSSNVMTRLPGAKVPVIRVSEADSNQVTIRVCWRMPSDDRTRVYELASYVY